MNIKLMLRQEAIKGRRDQAVQNWDRLWRERKMQRLFHPVQEAAKQLKAELARKRAGTVIIQSDTVEIALRDSRVLNINLSLYFDRRDNLNQKYEVIDREIRRFPDYEEVDSTHSFPTAAEAIHYVITVCAEYLEA